MIEAVAQVADNNAVIVQRFLIDGGLVAIIVGVIKLIFTMGSLRQVINNHNDRLNRLENDSDARNLAELNGYRARDRGRGA